MLDLADATARLEGIANGTPCLRMDNVWYYYTPAVDARWPWVYVSPLDGTYTRCNTAFLLRWFPAYTGQIQHAITTGY